jgi:hypothetical protein
LPSDTGVTAEGRVVELEHELRQRDDKIKELNRELDEARELVGRMREHAADQIQLIDHWIEVFEMQQGENGDWLFDPAQDELWEKHAQLWSEYRRLLQQWNKFVPRYNAVISPRERGRPLAASETQQAETLKRSKAGESLRGIAAATGLSLSTVRTIVDKSKGKDRTSKRAKGLRRQELDKIRAAAYRARKASRDKLPAEITELQKTGAALVKEAKGLGR